jgi:hypothetical protein
VPKRLGITIEKPPKTRFNTRCRGIASDRCPATDVEIVQSHVIGSGLTAAAELTPFVVDRNYRARMVKNGNVCMKRVNRRSENVLSRHLRVLPPSIRRKINHSGGRYNLVFLAIDFGICRHTPIDWP